MTKKVCTINKKDHVIDVAKTMAERDISAIIVMDNENVVGILTDTDLTRRVVAGGKDSKGMIVEEVMSSPVTSVDPNTGILDASMLLNKKGFKKLPVMKDKKLLGIVTNTDLINVMRATILDITPKAESKTVKTKPKFSLEPGLTYLIKESRAEKSFDIFVDNVMKGVHGLCISRLHPERIRRTYGLENTPILWLTDTLSEHDSISPYNFSELSILIGKFLNEVDRCVILLDGIEYLVTHNSYTQTLKLIQHLRDKISASTSHLIIPVNINALEKSQIELLEHEMDIVIGEIKVEKEIIKELKEEVEEGKLR